MAGWNRWRWFVDFSAFLGWSTRFNSLPQDPKIVPWFVKSKCCKLKPGSAVWFRSLRESSKEAVWMFCQAPSIDACSCLTNQGNKQSYTAKQNGSLSTPEERTSRNPNNSKVDRTNEPNAMKLPNGCADTMICATSTAIAFWVASTNFS